MKRGKKMPRPSRVPRGVQAVLKQRADLNANHCSRVYAGRWEVDLEQSNHLTPRQVEILQLLTKGYRDRRVAVELGIAHNTIHAHMRNILYALGARNRTHAVAIALRRGIIQ